MADPRRTILADPLATTHRRNGSRTHFVVAGQSAPGASGDVKMFEWDPAAESMSMVGCQTDVGGVKAITWSPLPTHRHLVALGLSTGRTQLSSLSSASLNLTMSGSTSPAPQPPLAALLTVKHSRPVTALSFSDRDPYLLAAGYDRHRSDYSLVIWDIAEAVAAMPRDSDGDAAFSRPAERLEVTNPLALRPASGLHSSKTDTTIRHVQQYCPSEAVQSVAWVPKSSTEVMASANSKVIRLYDLRAPAAAAAPSPRDPSAASMAGAAIQWSTRAVYTITPNPDRPQRLASVEQSPAGGIVRLWDTRRPGIELLNLPLEHDWSGGGASSSIVSLEWMRTPGMPDFGASALGVGTREGGISIWDIISGPQRADGLDEWTSVGGMRQVVKPKLNLQSFVFAPPTSPAVRDVVFVVKDGTIGAGPVGLAPSIASSARAELAVSASSLFILDPNVPSRTRASTPGTRSPRSRSHSRPQSRDPMTDDRRKNRFQLPPERVSALLAAERARSRDASPSGIGRTGRREGLDFEELDGEDEDYGDEVSGPDGFRRTLRHDIAFIMKRRVEEGYGLDNLLLNAAVGTRFPDADRLLGTWEFVDEFIQGTASDISIQGNYNLTYQGIWPIWSGQIGAPPSLASSVPGSAAWTALRAHNNSHLGVGQRDTGSAGSTPRRDAADLLDPDYTSAIAKINAARATAGASSSPGNHKLPHTEKMPQRRMILAVCGENHAYETMAEVNRLVDDDQRTKAACWAFFAGEEGPAVTILMRSDDERHRLMGATIAGFMTQSRAERGSLFWQEHWRSMVDKVDDPYVRAVLTRIAGEEWDGIIYDESLPLLDRIAVAVCNLSDKDLTFFLRNRLNRCIQLGSLQGLALTGFTPAGLDLLQAFVDRTGDVQTAALLSAFFPRSRLSTSQIAMLERWQEAYRDLLDSWMAWVPRCNFDVGVIARRREIGDLAADAVQTVVVCPACNNQLTKQTEEHLLRKNALRGAIKPPSVRVGYRAVHVLSELSATV
ncbi:SEH-associated protein 4 [Vanrija pseudolonga]|uniref:SEH-associated protein 4 n=1 Tax=Vanrija pseudolonga TaxID=143232 RepID=A0AAF0XZF4_9TREE|nr:SEH-associated protein 4 [Vanrija pseudolonga]WOO76940.1 SEH-associated protein 4 [Vanrija pseudolonga]